MAKAPPALRVAFALNVELTVHEAALHTGPLFVDPVVEVSTMGHDAGKRLVGWTSRKLFTAIPQWNETMRFGVPEGSTKIVIEVFDVTSKAIGHAFLPISLTCCSAAKNRRVMLVPQLGGEGLTVAGDEVTTAELRRLHDLQVDDFGHLLLSWTTTLAPCHGYHSWSAPVAMPLGPFHYTFKAIWLSNSQISTASFATTVELGDGQVMQCDDRCTTLQLRQAPEHLHFTLLKNSKQVAKVAVPIPLQISHAILNMYPVTTDDESGCLVVVLYVSPSDPPTGLWEFQIPGSPPQGSDIELAELTEQRWKKSCIVDAKLTQLHLRHLLDVQMRRMQLDPSLSSLFAAFFSNKTEIDVRQLLIGTAFTLLSIPEACRVSFVCMRKDAERAVTVDDIVFILQSALLPRCLDIPKTQLRRRVMDIFLGAEPSTYVTYDQYEQFFTCNYALWFLLGASLEFNEALHGLVPSQDSAQAEVWRKFALRVIKTGRAFAVTAHVDDSIEKIKRIVEESVAIAATRQKFVLEGKDLADDVLVGEINAELFAANREISVLEVEETIVVVFVHRASHKKWEHKVLVSDKILKLRGNVQQKTMIPLSRIHLTYAGATLWDRHSVEHCKLTNGSVIEVTEETA